jgi:hypothetical protein
MNKKGSDIPSFFYVIAIIFTIGLILFLLSHLNLDIYNTLNDAVQGIPGQSGASEVNETLTKVIAFEQSMWDYAFLALVLGYVISMILISFSTQINPVFYFIFVIFSGIGLFLGVGLSNAWQISAANSELADTTARFPIMNTILGNFYPLFITLTLVFIVVMLFGKRYLGGEAR